jgi:hypothetical protein
MYIRPTIKDNLECAVSWINENEMEQAAKCVLQVLLETFEYSHDVYGFDNPDKRSREFLTSVASEVMVHFSLVEIERS